MTMTVIVRNLMILGLRLLFWSLCAGLFLGGIAGGFLLIRGMEAPSPEVVAALTAGVLGLLGVLWNQRSLSRRQIDAAHHEHKAQVYTQFVEDVVIATLSKQADTPRKKLSDRDFRAMVRTYRDFTGKLMVWGSEDFMRAFAIFLNAGRERKGAEVLLSLDDLLRAMRRDLGHRDGALIRGDVVKLILKDPDELDEMLKGAAP